MASEIFVPIKNRYCLKTKEDLANAKAKMPRIFSAKFMIELRRKNALASKHFCFRHDVEKCGSNVGFYSWYVLQHYTEYSGAYRPFLTLIEFDVIVSDSYS